MDQRRKNAELRRRFADIAAQQKWFAYAKAAGMFKPDYEDDMFYTDSQADFFLGYELQLERLKIKEQ
jgi:hypothetical protein